MALAALKPKDGKINSYPPCHKPGGKILWLLGPGDNSKRTKYIVNQMGMLDNRARAAIHFVTVNTGQKFWIRKPKTKNTNMLVDDYEAVVEAALAPYLHAASVVVINDFCMLAALLQDCGGWGSKKTLDSYRGSRYYHKLTGGRPTIVVDDVSKAYMRDFGSSTAKAPHIYDMFNQYDFKKIIRHYYGHENDSSVVPFDDQYTLFEYDKSPGTSGGSFTPTKFAHDKHGETYWKPAQNWDNVTASRIKANEQRIADFAAWINAQSLIAVDFETTINFISSVQVSGITGADISTIKTYTIPFINTQEPNQQHMPFGDFFELLWLISNSPAQKIYTNGSYDAHYHIKYNCPPIRYDFDIMHLWHSYRSQMPKSLATIASIYCDQYYFWKDEVKGGAEEKRTQTKFAVPVTEKGLQMYWRYGGQDTYYTLLAAVNMLPELCQHDWVMENYGVEMALQFGPLMAASYKGTHLDTKKLRELVDGERERAFRAQADLSLASAGLIETCTDNEVKAWLFDHLRAPLVPRGKQMIKTADQKALQLVAETHPFFDRAIEMIRDVREPKKRVQMYSQMKYEHQRFQYKYSIAGTYTGRLSGKGSDFWLGTNPQNMPAFMRPFVTADEGKVLIDIDYSQADLYHFAVACGDPTMLANVFDDRDTHAVHVEMILKVPYDDVIEGKRNNDPAIVHPIKGVRQIIKKICHGGNYGMTPPTAYLNAGRESLIAAAHTLGYNPSKWTRSRFYDFTEELTAPYFEAYSRQKPWRQELVDQCIENKGLVTCFGGRTTYFHQWNRPKDRQALMRALLAYMGQGGTAGMINRAMLGMYYGYWDHENQQVIYTPGQVNTSRPTFLQEFDMDLLLQTHDSITYQATWSNVLKYDLINKLLIAMEIPCTFNGTKYVVPCEVNVGPRWHKKMPEVKRKDDATTTTLKLLQSFVELE